MQLTARRICTGFGCFDSVIAWVDLPLIEGNAVKVTAGPSHVICGERLTGLLIAIIIAVVHFTVNIKAFSGSPLESAKVTDDYIPYSFATLASFSPCRLAGPDGECSMRR